MNKDPKNKGNFGISKNNTEWTTFWTLQLSLGRILPVSSAGDLNQCMSTCLVQCFDDTKHAPVQSWGVCFVFKAGNHIAQLYVNNYQIDGALAWIRSFEPNSGVWASWNELQLSLDIFKFSDNVAIASLSVWDDGGVQLNIKLTNDKVNRIYIKNGLISQTIS